MTLSETKKSINKPKSSAYTLLTYVLLSHVLRVVAHMCSRVAVMTQGKIIEELSADDLRNQSAKTEYTRQLIQASRGKATA